MDQWEPRVCSPRSLNPSAIEGDAGYPTYSYQSLAASQTGLDEELPLGSSLAIAFDRRLRPLPDTRLQARRERAKGPLRVFWATFFSSGCPGEAFYTETKESTANVHKELEAPLPSLGRRLVLSRFGEGADLGFQGSVVLAFDLEFGLEDGEEFASPTVVACAVASGFVGTGMDVVESVWS